MVALTDKPLAGAKEVAKQFRLWLKENPKAKSKEKFVAFDEIADEIKGR